MFSSGYLISWAFWHLEFHWAYAVGIWYLFSGLSVSLLLSIARPLLDPPPVYPLVHSNFVALLFYIQGGVVSLDFPGPLGPFSTFSLLILSLWALASQWLLAFFTFFTFLLSADVRTLPTIHFPWPLLLLRFYLSSTLLLTLLHFPLLLLLSPFLRDLTSHHSSAPTLLYIDACSYVTPTWFPFTLFRCLLLWFVHDWWSLVYIPSLYHRSVLLLLPIAHYIFASCFWLLASCFLLFAFQYYYCSCCWLCCSHYILSLTVNEALCLLVI